MPETKCQRQNVADETLETKRLRRKETKRWRRNAEDEMLETKGDKTFEASNRQPAKNNDIPDATGPALGRKRANPDDTNDSGPLCTATDELSPMTSDVQQNTST